MYLIRNPWNNTKFNQNWNHNDRQWTLSTLRQVPLGIDIRRSHTDGIFAIESVDFLRCFYDYQIGHLRQSEGYVDTWYDRENDDGTEKSYKFQPPYRRGDLYISVESYYMQMIPNTCTNGVNPLLKYTVYRNGAFLGYKWYYDQFHYPYLIKEADYASRDVFEITVLWDWKGYQGNDYTIKVYSRQAEI